MHEERIRYLLNEYASNQASKEEVKELFECLKQPGGMEILREKIMDEKMNAGEDPCLFEQDWDKIWLNISSKTIRSPQTSPTIIVFLRLLAAAVFVGIVCSTWMLWNREKTDKPVISGNYKTNIHPDHGKAILILDNDSIIYLNTLRDGTIIRQGNSRIIKLSSGKIAYRSAGKGGNIPLFNTVSTLPGGQMEVLLPDSSRVWLNAKSSLRFPTSFAGAERAVELKGEAYFEVAGNAFMPFHVKLNQTDIKVLGTHFNIMAYPDEKATNTTLLTGSVQVTTDGHTRKLIPGQQAVIDNHSPAIKVMDANIEEAIAWKNGLFWFRNTGIREVMQQVKRWYNVEVEYRTQRSDQEYTGVVSRTQNLSTLLQTLELTGTVHFQINGDKIIVLP